MILSNCFLNYKISNIVKFYLILISNYYNISNNLQLKVLFMMQLIGGRIAFHLIDDGLANTLGLETLRHGTNLLNRASIKMFGGLIEHGGSIKGSTHNNSDDSNVGNAFYLFKDSAWKIVNDEILYHFQYQVLTHAIVRFRQHHSFVKILPTQHAYLSSLNLIKGVIDINKFPYNKNTLQQLLSIACIASAVFSAILTPTLNFRASILGIEKNPHWKNDDRYFGAAYRITESVKPSQIGLLGTLTQGINTEIFARIKRNPAKCLTGVLQLTAGIALVALAIQAAYITPQVAVGFAVANAILV